MRSMTTQRDNMGCGAACAAFAANTTYQKAVSRLGEDKARSVGFQCKELTNTLGQLGYAYTHKHVNAVKEKRLLKEDGVIVFIKRSSRYPFGHYLVRHKGQWGDPWINLVTNPLLSDAQSGFRQRLPGQAQWVLLPIY